MKAAQDDLNRITRQALDALQNNLIFSKYVNREYEDRLGHHTPRKPISRYMYWKNEVRGYLRNLKGAWRDAIRALAGKDPHEHCDEDY